MKTILIFILSLLLLTSCIERDVDVERHELMLIMVDLQKKGVLMYDINEQSYVNITYSYGLFQMEWLQICQIKGNPTFFFYKSENNYYRL